MARDGQSQTSTPGQGNKHKSDLPFPSVSYSLSLAGNPNSDPLKIEISPVEIMNQD